MFICVPEFAGLCHDTEGRICPYSSAMSLSDPEFVALQTALRGRYSIEQELGRGGMGVVYLAHDVQLERPVAIKLLAPELAADARMRARFLREARLAAMCFHPNIVPMHSVDESGELAWFVMAYVRGESLADRVRRTGALSAENVRRLAEDIGWALAYAHDRGVVHRDVKPENILIDAGSERFLLADFGIALQNDVASESVPRSARERPSPSALENIAPPSLVHIAPLALEFPHSAESARPKHGMLAGAGTPRYMAPEQARGDAVDGRADLYALGASLFHAASGRPPFDATSANSLLYQHAAVAPPSIRTLAPALASNLADAIDQCLAKLPADRFLNAAAFVRAIKPPEAERSLPPSLQSVQANMVDAKGALGWAVIIGGTSVLLALGEDGSSFSRGIIWGIGSAMASFMAVVAALRAGESIVATRRALRAGVAREDAVTALAGLSQADDAQPSQRKRGAWLIAAGVIGALLQGRLAPRGSLPELLDFVLQVVLLFGPAYLIGRGVPGVVKGSKLADWIRRHVANPVAKTVVRIAGAFLPVAPSRPFAAQMNAPTEVRLEHAVRVAMNRLPAAHQQLMHGTNAAANALAEEARRLRGEDAALLAQERLARQNGTGDERAERLLSLESQRTAVQHRLSAAVAALETLRLDLMRLDVATPSRGGLTTELAVVRDLARRVDAMSELRAYLAQSTPTPV